MTLQDKAQKTVDKLLAMTQDRELQWSRIPDSAALAFGTDDFIEVAYEAEHAGSHFVIYESRFKNMDENERMYWDNRVELNLVDDNRAVLWQLPRMSSLWSLLEAVRVRGGGVEEKLDSFLGS